jgi:hypothetical protein
MMTGNQEFDHDNVFTFTANLLGAFVDSSSEKQFMGEKDPAG